MDLAGLRNRMALDYLLVVDALPRENTEEHAFDSQEAVEELILAKVREGFKRKLESFGEHQEGIASWIMLGVIDEKWRDHLYDLDHLKASIGFRGWGQKDPLVEYKQEAYNMFVDLMTDIRRSISSLTFRAQLAVPQPPPPPAKRLVLSGPTDTPSTAPQRAVPAPEPLAEEKPRDAISAALGGAREIARPQPASQPRQPAAAASAPRSSDAAAKPVIGRNDPCPCGSGKKYKKCHGVGMA